MKKRIILIGPRPSKYHYYKGMPNALLAIASLPANDPLGYDIKIIKANPKEEIISKILSYMDDSVLIIGISMMTGYQIKAALDILEVIKTRFPNVPVVVGGPHPSILPNQTLENNYIDFVIKGQGEITFYELVKSLNSDCSFEKILGLGYKKEGKIFINPDRPMENLNNFPKLPYHLINIEENLLDELDYIKGKTLDYVSSQGCPKRCGFCSEQNVYKRRWVALSPERVVDDLFFFYTKFGIKNFMFGDSNFFVDSSRVERICRLIIEKGMNISWGNANGRTDSLLSYSEEQWRIMVQSGLKSLLVGAESGDEEIMKFIEKDSTVQNTILLTELCKKYNVLAHFSCIVGFPHPNPNASKREREEFFDKELKSFYKLVDDIFSISKKHTIMVSIFTPYPGTPLYDLSLKSGVKEPKSLEDWAHYELSMRNTPWITKKQEDLISQLMVFVLKGNRGVFRDKIMNMRGKLKIPLSLLNSLYETTANVRWSLKFFKFPVEYKIIDYLHNKNIISRIKNLIK